MFVEFFFQFTKYLCFFGWADMGHMAGEQRMNLVIWVCVNFWRIPDTAITENKYWNQVVTTDEFASLHLYLLA